MLERFMHTNGSLVYTCPVFSAVLDTASAYQNIQKSDEDYVIRNWKLTQKNKK